jgi:tetratricopeptide (TPR) repeat protein
MRRLSQAFRLARMYAAIMEGRRGDASRLAARAVKRDPRDDEAQMTYAWLLHVRDEDAALRHAKAAVALAPTSAEILTRAATVFGALSGSGDADVDLFRAYVMRARAYATASFAFPAALASLEGRLAEVDGRFDDAEAAYRTSLKLYRPWPDDTPRAETEPLRVQSLTALLEDPANLVQPLVRLLRQQGRTDEAVAVVTRMTQAWPEATGLAKFVDELS